MDTFLCKNIQLRKAPVTAINKQRVGVDKQHHCANGPGERSKKNVDGYM
ncbi:MAG: hypothetical protein V4722_08115 [Bacteroidota bacterium]